MTIYKKRTKKYAKANQLLIDRDRKIIIYKNKRRRAKKVSKYSRLKTNLSKWFYGKMGLLN